MSGTKKARSTTIQCLYIGRNYVGSEPDIGKIKSELAKRIPGQALQYRPNG
jgi:hypothetical protein